MDGDGHRAPKCYLVLIEVRSFAIAQDDATSVSLRCRQLQIIKWQSLGSFFISPLITWPRSMW